MLFIGGLVDGQWIDVPPGRKMWRVAERIPVVSFQVQDLEKPPSQPFAIKITTYLKMPFRGYSREFFVMAEEKMTPDDVITRLLNNYSPKVRNIKCRR